MSIRDTYFGDRKFYKRVLTVAVPIMLQNGLTNFVSLLDNLMVGKVGTDQMSGVAIVNQLLFILYLSIFGGLAGAGIYTAQFFGKQDTKGIQNVFRLKLLIAGVITVIGVLVLYFWKQPLTTAFLHEGSETGNIEVTLKYALSYMNYMLPGLFFYALSQCFASTLRECGETVAPMIASGAAVLVNLCFNYILIFGKFGAPVLGVNGAAIATVLSRIVECGLIILWIYRHREQQTFIVGFMKNFSIPWELTIQVIKKGMPLLVNEFLWSAGVTMQMQSYSTRGLAAVAGINICNTINNVFNIVFIAMGDAIAILVGQLLGAGKMKEAKEADTRMITFSVLCCLGIAAIMALCAPFFPLLYNTTEEVRHLATGFIWIMALLMPFCAFTHASYFTLRSGGQTIATFIFDSLFVWTLCVPAAFLLSRYTKISVLPMYLCVQSLEVLKCVVGFVLVRKGGWLKNLVGTE